MKKIFFAAVAIIMTALSVNAQVKIESPHPDLDIKITRCAYASGTVVIDMVITNFGPDSEIRFCGSWDVNARNARSSAYDDEGNLYDGPISTGLLGKDLDRSGRHILFPQDIPLKYRVTVEGVKNTATKFSLLKVGVKTDDVMNVDFKYVTIRNLEWVK